MKVMQSVRDFILFVLNIIRFLPHLILFHTHKNKSLIQADMKRAFELMERDYMQTMGLVFLLAFPPFRNIFYFRTRPYGSMLSIIYPQLQTLHIHTKNIDEGLAVIHGTAAEIGAESIGKNCTIFHLVSIGGTKHGAPIIGDNVTIYTGAIIIGKITIGNNVVIGANATVFSNVPDDCTVLPGTSKIMRWKKKSV